MLGLCDNLSESCESQVLAFESKVLGLRFGLEGKVLVNITEYSGQSIQLSVTYTFSIRRVNHGGRCQVIKVNYCEFSSSSLE